MKAAPPLPPPLLSVQRHRVAGTELYGHMGLIVTRDNGRVTTERCGQSIAPLTYDDTGQHETFLRWCAGTGLVFPLGASIHHTPGTNIITLDI